MVFGNAASASTTATVTGGDASIQAGFAINTYTLSVQSDGGGSVSPASSSVNHGGSVSITAVADVAHDFVNWTKVAGVGSVVFANSLSPSTTATVTDGDVTVQANFRLKEYTLGISAGTGGSATPSGNQLVQYGVPIGIAATPGTGYNFAGWTKTGGTGTVTFGNSALASTTVAVTGGSATIQANFSLKQYTLNVSYAGSGSVSPSGNVTVTHGVPQSIVATPGSGQVLTGWSVVSGTGASIADPASESTSVTLTGGDASVRATFAEYHGFQTIATNPSSATNTAVFGNRVFVVYYDGSTGDLMYMRSGDYGKTYTSPIAVDSSGDVGQYCSMKVLRSSGIPSDFYTVEVAYYDATNARLKFISFDSLATSGFAPVVVDSGSVGQYCRLAYVTPALNTTKRVIAYYDAGNQSLKLAKRGANATDPWYVETVLDDASLDIGKYCDITAGALLSSTVYLSFVNGGTRVGRAYTSAVNWTGTTTWTTTFYNAANTVDYTGIALSGANGVISFRANSVLKVLKSSDSFVNVGIASTVDSNTNAGQNARIQYVDSAFRICYVRNYQSGATVYKGVYFLSSTDNGATWTKRTVVDSSFGAGGVGIPSLAFDGSRVYCTYSSMSGIISEPVALVQAKSLDGGVTW